MTIRTSTGKREMDLGTAKAVIRFVLEQQPRHRRWFAEAG